MVRYVRLGDPAICVGTCAIGRICGVTLSDLHPQPVTVSVVRTVQPGRTRQASAWAHAGQELAREWPGYLGSGWVRTSGDSNEWHMLYRFANADLLNDWEQSGERRWWIDSAADLVEVTQIERRTGIEGWFAQPGDARLTVPETVVPVTFIGSPIAGDMVAGPGMTFSPCH